MHSDIETDLDDISKSLANVWHVTGNVHEKLICDVSEALDIILEQTILQT